MFYLICFKNSGEEGGTFCQISFCYNITKKLQLIFLWWFLLGKPTVNREVQLTLTWDFSASVHFSLSLSHAHTHTGASGKLSANVENFTSGSSSSTWFDHLLPFHEACWTHNSSLLMKRPRARVTWGQRGFPSTMSLLGCLRNPQTGWLVSQRWLELALKNIFISPMKPRLR